MSGKTEPDAPAVRNAVVALGRLRPARMLLVVGPPGDQIADVLTKEGALVPAGKELVKLMSHVDRLAEVNMLKQQIESAKEQQQLAIANAEREALLAEAKVDELKTVAPLEIEAQAVQLEVLKKKQETQSARLGKMESLKKVSPNTVPDQELETLRLQLAQTESELKAGDVLLQKARAAHKSGVKVADLQLTAAQANQKRAKADKSIEALQQKLALADLQLQRTHLKAPWAGRVLKVSSVPGEATAPQQPILQLADTSTMSVVAEVYETDVKQLRAWCKDGKVRARIVSRALPSELSGTVAADRIGTIISRNTVLDIDPTADADRRVFEVPVILDQPDVASQYVNLQVQVFLEPVP